MADPDVDLDAHQGRFAYLLKPIRDLEECFSLNIAHELDEYLEQIANVQFDLENNGRTVDFAEAALLIQGSTCVYSKKVEYLRVLVYQALESVKGTRRQQVADEAEAGPSQPGPRGRNAAAVRTADDGTEAARQCIFYADPFSAKEAVDEDLAPGDGVLPSAGNIVRMPAMLLALEDQGQGSTASAAAKGDGDSGVYRLQQCFIHSSGTLMLDPQDADKYDNYVRYIGPQKRKDQSLEELLEPFMPAAVQRPPAAAANTQQAQPGSRQAPQDQGADGAGPMDLDPGGQQGQEPGAFGDFGDDDGGGGYGGGGDWDDEGALPPQPPDGAPGADPAAGMQGEAAGGAGGEEDGAAAANQRPRRTAAKSTGTAAAPGDEAGEGDPEQDAEEEEFDPYKPLDPNVRSKAPDRPLQVRRPAGNLAGLWDGGKHTAAPLPTFPAALEALQAPAPDGFPLPEFAYSLAWLRPAAHAVPPVGREGGAAAGPRAQKEKAEAAANKPRRLRGDLEGPVFEAKDVAAAAAALDDEPEEDARGAQPASAAVPPPYGFDDDDDVGGGGFAGGGGSDLDDDPLGPPGAGQGPGGEPWHDGGDGGFLDGFDPEAGTAPPGRAGLWPGPVPAMGDLDGMAVDGGQEKTFEELCRQHIESMIAAAARPELQSDLVRRVNGWKERIHPLLRAEESRPAFDIQHYGQRLLNKLSELQDKQRDQPAEARAPAANTPLAAFSYVAADLEKYEVPRMFSAMLQLINNRNVAICLSSSEGVPPGQVPDEPFKLQLLSTEMYHLKMGERLAAKPAPRGQAVANTGDQGPADPVDGGDGGDEDDPSYGENRGVQQRGKGAKAAGGRGKAAGGGAKRAKKAAPLADLNFDDD